MTLNRVGAPAETGEAPETSVDFADTFDTIAEDGDHDETYTLAQLAADSVEFGFSISRTNFTAVLTRIDVVDSDGNVIFSESLDEVESYSNTISPGGATVESFVLGVRDFTTGRTETWNISVNSKDFFVANPGANHTHPL